MMNKESTSPEKKIHSGKWGREEEAYTEALIEEFQRGRLDIQDGTTLRSYLATMLNCKPKRISKKFEGKEYDGKQLFFKTDEKLSPEEVRRGREKLQRLRNRFHESAEAIDVAKEKEFQEKSNAAKKAPPASLSFHQAVSAMKFSPTSPATGQQLQRAQMDRTNMLNQVSSPSSDSFPPPLGRAWSHSSQGAAGLPSSSGSAFPSDLWSRSISHQRRMDLTRAAQSNHIAYANPSVALRRDSSLLDSRWNSAAANNSLGGINTAPGPMTDNARRMLFDQRLALERARLAAVARNRTNLFRAAAAPSGASAAAAAAAAASSFQRAPLDSWASALNHNAFAATSGYARRSSSLGLSNNSPRATGGSAPSTASLEETLSRMRQQQQQGQAISSGRGNNASFMSNNSSEERKRQSLEEELEELRTSNNANKRQRFF